ncbi:MAG: thiamine pyrophosphate-dependent enzyme, partial [Flavobacteriales bacterium]
MNKRLKIMTKTMQTVTPPIGFDDFKKEVLGDYRLACESREASIMGRREVLTGKAKFGIFGDGKEVAQIALAKQFRAGDFRSGYYRDQTFMMAAGLCTLHQFFAQLYAHTDLAFEPFSAGRQMNNHFSTRLLDDKGLWKELVKEKNSASDVSPIASQMPRALGLAYASKMFRENEHLKDFTSFSDRGNEVCFATIGDAGTSEGMFFETLNAAGVLQVPLVVSVWDDGYGISVPRSLQTVKDDISQALSGFAAKKGKKGVELFEAKGHDYAGLHKTFETAVATARDKHIPVLVHVREMTQPQGHSTSGSHERYKSPERLQWEKEFDPIQRMKNWMLHKGIAATAELDTIEDEAKQRVKEAKKAAWKAYQQPLLKEREEVNSILINLLEEGNSKIELEAIQKELMAGGDLMRKDIFSAARKAYRLLHLNPSPAVGELKQWIASGLNENRERYGSHLHSRSPQSALAVEEVEPTYGEEKKLVDGRIVLRDNFDANLARRPELLIFGEDSGKIGGVNQGLEGLQEKYGELRVFDTGIRECTIIGQGIGLAMRGLRPIAEIQYLDYLLYALQLMSDDLASLHYRTRGGQKSPLIIRTRGHRLEGIWHGGSPMASIINAIRGIYVCVPRNMTQAAGFYNTLLSSDDSGLVIESLNGYRLKEELPLNPAEYKIPLGVPEIIRRGDDITLVSYGSMVRL